jgi:tetratricopeptide (TPR) repeat protein
MFATKNFLKRYLSLSVIILIPGLFTGRAQDAALEEIKYQEDYDRLQRIAAVKQPIKRAEQLATLFTEKKDLDSKLKEYANGLFVQDMDALVKQGSLVAAKGFAERVIHVNPKFGAVYLYYGVALKNEKKMKEAMNAFAKCHLLPNQFQQRAKQQLDVVYRSLNKGSMVGQDKFIKAVEAELK